MFKVGDYIRNAIKFIKDNGVEKAREVVECAPKDAELFHTNTYIKNAHSEGRTDHFARWSDGFNGWVNASADREFIDESIALEELERLVESVELIKCFGDLEQAKSWLSDLEDNCPSVLKVDTCDNPFYKHELKQDIANYEAIYGDSK